MSDGNGLSSNFVGMYDLIVGDIREDVVGGNCGLENLQHFSMSSYEMVSDQYMAPNLGSVSGCPTRVVFSIAGGAFLEDETNESAVYVPLPNVDEIVSTRALSGVKKLSRIFLTAAPSKLNRSELPSRSR